MKKTGRLLVAVFFLVLIILYIIIYTIPKMHGILEDTTVLKHGDLPVADDANALLIRNETLFEAGSEGKLDYKVKEGTKIRKGTKILDLKTQRVVERKKDSDGNEIEPESSYKEIIDMAGKGAEVSNDYTAKISGVVSYDIDGYEKIFTEKNIKNIDKDTIENTPAKGTDVKRDSTLKGEPIYKVADNIGWYLVIWKDKDEDISNYKKDSKVKINIGNTQIVAIVDGVHNKGDGNLVVLKTDMYYKNYYKYRKVEVSVVFAEYQGLIVENKSIATRNGVQGVYVKQTDEKFKFTPVNVIATSGDYSALSVKRFYDDNGKEILTVNHYEEIMTEPEGYDDD